MDGTSVPQTVPWETEISSIQDVLRTRHLDWRSCLPAARGVIALLEETSPTTRPLNVQQRILVISTLQQLAYQDADSGGEADIALWCERQWATILQSHPDNVDALQGLGHAWLLRSQETLARIYREEGSPSSSGSSTANTRRVQGRQDDIRIASPDFVQARDLLRPSLEFLDRTIEVTTTQGMVSGDLLALGAEAYINFGNVSHPQENEQYYQQALRYLQRANGIESFELEAHLQQFLDDNLRFLD